ncbi:hypothetical protein cand_035900 [Cryptosporidium andersoni]|uniref:Splicing factor Cactin n=1 Tax=Cryptosporidium andersoni TaxID=117008 RepID=A0A1J4MXB4_9CRYT|nr:hypothetical protein cand_035900 [Cryptosporidium andersoni]
MEEEDSDIKYPKLRRLNECRSDRLRILQKLGYTDDNNPFGDSSLSVPFIWKKKLEIETLNSEKHQIEHKGNMYPWSKYGVYPIEIDEVLAIHRRREEFEVNESPRKNHLTKDEETRYLNWLEDEEKLQSYQIKSLSVIKLKERRESVLDQFFWKILLFSFFNNNNKHFNTSNYISPLSQSLDSLILTGLGTPLSYLLWLRHCKLSSQLEDILRHKDKHILNEITREVDFHISFKDDNSSIELAPEWTVVLYGLKYILKKTEIDSNTSENDDDEIKKVIREKDLDELHLMKKDIENKLQDDQEYWSKVIVIINIQITYNTIEIIESMYQRNASKWLDNLASKYKIELSQSNNTESLKSEINHSEIEEGTKREIYCNNEDEQFVQLPMVEFPIPSRSGNLSNHQRNDDELLVPQVYSKINARYVWNRYNRNYYNEDSLPPKTIHGYTFRVKFPELLKGRNKHIVPRWYITTKRKYIEINNIEISEKQNIDTPEDDNMLIFENISCNFVLLVITCDRNIYKDIAFSIIDKEWDKNTKSGFKNTFENGTLYLNFNFKSMRYRR